MLDSHRRVNMSRLRLSPSVPERVRQAIGRDDRGCSSIFV